MRPFSLLLLTTALAFALVACGADEEVMPPEEPPAAEPPPDEEAIDTFEISMTDFDLDPATFTVAETGTYEFRAVNDGDHPHALAISGPGVEESSEIVSPGETAELVVTLEAGEYELWCPVENHRQLGMDGSVSVGDDAGAGAEDDAELEEQDEADVEPEDGLGY